MTATEMEQRLTQLRRGFDIAIERTLREKAAKGRPVVVVGDDGSPVMRNATNALDDFMKRRSAKAAVNTHTRK